MKKLMAFGLASAMALSMASAALATTTQASTVSNKVGGIGQTPYKYDTDKAVVDLQTPNPGFSYGDTLYYPLLSDKGVVNGEELKKAEQAVNVANQALTDAKAALTDAETDSGKASEALVAAQAKLESANALLTAAQAWDAAIQNGQNGDAEQATYAAAAQAHGVTPAAASTDAVTESQTVVDTETATVATAQTAADAAALAVETAKADVTAKQTVADEALKAYNDLKAANFEYVYEYDAVRSIKIKQSWDTNGKLVKNVDIVKKKANINASANQNFIYFVAVNLNESTSTSTNDLTGTIQLRKSGEFDYEERQLDVALEVSFPIATQGVITDKLQLFKEGEGFAGDSEDELRFEDDEDSYYTVNTIGQGKLLLSMNTKFDADVAARFPSANLDFFNGNGATFNKIGTMTLSADEGSYLYKVNKDGSLTHINASYDEYEEAFTFKTRTLERYVISDTELKNTNAPAGSDDSVNAGDGTANDNITVVPSTPGTVNPGTGASL